MRRGEQSKGGYGRVDVQGRSDASRNYNLERFQCTQASDMGSIPIARSITHDDSIVLTPLNQLNTATKFGVLVPCWSQEWIGPNVPQPEVGRRWTPQPSIGRCFGVDHLNPSFLNFDLENS